MNKARDPSGFEMIGNDRIGSPDEISRLVDTDHRPCAPTAVDSNPDLQINIVFLEQG
jgi:hypothetical protein